MGGLKRTPGGDVDYHEDFFSKPAFLTVSGQLQVEGGGRAADHIQFVFRDTLRSAAGTVSLNTLFPGGGVLWTPALHPGFALTCSLVCLLEVGGIFGVRILLLLWYCLYYYN